MWDDFRRREASVVDQTGVSHVYLYGTTLPLPEEPDLSSESAYSEISDFAQTAPTMPRRGATTGPVARPPEQMMSFEEHQRAAELQEAHGAAVAYRGQEGRSSRSSYQPQVQNPFARPEQNAFQVLPQGLSASIRRSHAIQGLQVESSPISSSLMPNEPMTQDFSQYPGLENDPFAQGRLQSTQKHPQMHVANPFMPIGLGMNASNAAMQRLMNEQSTPVFQRGTVSSSTAHELLLQQPVQQLAQPPMQMPPSNLLSQRFLGGFFGHMPDVQLPPFPEQILPRPEPPTLAPASRVQQPPILEELKYLNAHHGRPPVNVQWPLDIDIGIIEICTFCPDWLLVPEMIARAVRNGWSRQTLAKAILHAENRLTRGNFQTAYGRVQKQISIGCKLVEGTSLASIAGGGARFNSDDFRNSHGLQHDLTANSWRLRGTYTSAHPVEEMGHMRLSTMLSSVVNWPTGADRLLLTQCMEYARDHPEENLDTRHWDEIIKRHGFTEPPAPVPARGVNRDTEALEQLEQAADP